jgi:hypothetical protein
MPIKFTIGRINLTYLFFSFPSVLLHQNLPSPKAEHFKLTAADEHPIENRQQAAETAGRRPAVAAQSRDGDGESSTIAIRWSN